MFDKLSLLFSKLQFLARETKNSTLTHYSFRQPHLSWASPTKFNIALLKASKLSGQLRTKSTNTATKKCLKMYRIMTDCNWPNIQMLISWMKLPKGWINRVWERSSRISRKIRKRNQRKMLMPRRVSKFHLKRGKKQWNLKKVNRCKIIRFSRVKTTFNLLQTCWTQRF